jgi:hypothetical protein
LGRAPARFALLVMISLSFLAGVAAPAKRGPGPSSFTPEQKAARSAAMKTYWAKRKRPAKKAEASQ